MWKKPDTKDSPLYESPWGKSLIRGDRKSSSCLRPGLGWGWLGRGKKEPFGRMVPWVHTSPCHYRTVYLKWWVHSLYIMYTSVKKTEKKKCLPWMVWFSGLSAGLQTKGSQVRLPVWAHAWVSGQVPSRGHVRDNCTLMFLSLSFSLPSPLSTNK